MSDCVYPHGTTRLPLDGLKKKNSHLRIFKKSVEKIQDALKSDRLTGPLREDLFMFMAISSSRISASGSSYRENVNKYFMFDSSFF